MVHGPVMLPKGCSWETKTLGAPGVGVTPAGQAREAGGSDNGREQGERCNASRKNPLLCLRLTLALRAVGGKAIAGQEPRTDGQQSMPGGCCSSAAPVSAAKARSKAIISTDVACRGLIQDLHCPESCVRRVPGAGEGPRPTRGATTRWDRVLSDAGQDAGCTSTLKLTPGIANADGVLREYFSP